MTGLEDFSNLKFFDILPFIIKNDVIFRYFSNNKFSSFSFKMNAAAKTQLLINSSYDIGFLIWFRDEKVDLNSYHWLNYKTAYL